MTIALIAQMPITHIASPTATPASIVGVRGRDGVAWFNQFPKTHLSHDKIFARLRDLGTSLILLVAAASVMERPTMPRLTAAVFAEPQLAHKG